MATSMTDFLLPLDLNTMKLLFTNEGGNVKADMAITARTVTCIVKHRVVLIYFIFLIGPSIQQIWNPVVFNHIVRQTQKEREYNFPIRYPYREDSSRKQRIFPKQMPFPCTNFIENGWARSPRRPTSVHQLRPGDIDVIGAMGDSLVAGNGALEEWALGTIIEYRGVSWVAGGENTWRKFLTLPNILKEFNKNLTGYSTGTGEFLHSNSRLNVAFPVAADADALKQAKILVNKIRKDPTIDFHNDWKMITIFFGANDLCSAQCFNPEGATPNQHARKLMVALDYLQAQLPRTFVNLIPVLDVSVSVRVKRSPMCRFLHTLFCSCFHQLGNVDEMSVITTLTREYQRAEELLIGSGRYDKKDDFTVVIQPFIKSFNAPLDPQRQYDQVIDNSFITYDCFHFSQKGHALGANLLWNNILEPVGNKTTQMRGYMEQFLCPTKETPYLFTKKNSIRYYQTGRQI
ncbi:phospholipase B1, membrane-associated-like [Chrysoperla carnea]|uniref:phospholipase B1, membrane-associated-like n=1 Tax=Chrysoperla carnea TaxID=189513 RepID=UPI001D098CAB|nr:phospholipase B1, membrane-associated-like [Chrysoperla carnea]